MMKKTTLLLIAIFALCLTVSPYYAQSLDNLNAKIDSITSSQKKLENEIKSNQSKIVKLTSEIGAVKKENAVLRERLNRTESQYTELDNRQNTDRTTLESGIASTQTDLQSTRQALSKRTVWVIVIAGLLIFGLLTVIVIVRRRAKTGASSFAEVKKAQKNLEDAQKRLLEESVKLDGKLISLLESQVNANGVTSGSEADHSLALKVADEIVRIETNLSRMDESVKGYKQLSKAVQRIKDNFLANGYEIVDMLGKPYNAGMKAIVDFIPNEDLEQGQQIITGITKPQVMYNGTLIQAAQITVSQNI